MYFIGHRTCIAGHHLLIIDDLGLRPLRQNEPSDLYEVIRQRSAEMFLDPIAAGDQTADEVVLDRLVGLRVEVTNCRRG